MLSLFDKRHFHIDFLSPDPLRPGLHPRLAAVQEGQMLDVVMLALGIGSFAVLLGYVALCDKL